MKLSEMRSVFYVLGGAILILSLAGMAAGMGSAAQFAKVDPKASATIMASSALSGLIGIVTGVAWVMVGLLTKEVERLRA